jgi:hypothetical protein
MNDSTTIAVRRLAARATGPITHWRRLPGHLAAGDTLARQAGWTITRTKLGGRIYRDPRFGQPGAVRTSRPPHQPARPPPPGTPPASRTSLRPPPPAGQIGPQGSSR